MSRPKFSRLPTLRQPTSTEPQPRASPGARQATGGTANPSASSYDIEVAHPNTPDGNMSVCLLPAVDCMWRVSIEAVSVRDSTQSRRAEDGRSRQPPFGSIGYDAYEFRPFSIPMPHKYIIFGAFKLHPKIPGRRYILVIFLFAWLMFNYYYFRCGVSQFCFSLWHSADP